MKFSAPQPQLRANRKDKISRSANFLIATKQIKQMMGVPKNYIQQVLPQ